MGYNTDFVGELYFTKPITEEQEKKLKTFLGANCSEYPEWESNDFYLGYINLEFTDDFDGLQWDHSEKSYDMVKKINLILREMRKEFPNFGLYGELEAYGEIPGDLWKIVIENGWAVGKGVTITESIIKCPHCYKEINLSN